MHRSVRTIATALAAACFLAFLEVYRNALTHILAGHRASFSEVFVAVVPRWLAIVLISPWCALMAWWFPFRRGQTARALLAHLGGAVVFGVLHLTLLRAFRQVVFIDGRAFSIAHFIHMYAFFVAMEMSVYVAIVVVLLFLEARREAAEREVASARLAQSVTAARLESLQAQIRPHFLFNTLNALAVLARKGDGQAVDRAIGALGELLHASFETPGRHEIRLAEELEFLERYVYLQRIRFPDRLDVTWDIADETRQALVPALLVQPLVENALEHGLATVRGGHVRVAARRDQDMLEVEVADDGPGFGAALASEGANPGASGGVGLANTRERLSLLYGARGTLACSDQPGGGGLVRIRIPWRIVAGPAGATA